MITLFIGVPGAGKTLGAQNVTAIASQEWPCFVIDHTPEEWGPVFEGRENPRWYGNVPFILDVPYGTTENTLDFLSEHDKGIFRFCQGDGWEPREVALLTMLRGDAYYVDDEIDLFATYKNWQDNPLKEFVHRGRHLLNADGVSSEVHVIGCARRVQNLHTDLTAMTDQAYIFRSQGARTIARLREEGYLEGDQLEEVRSLENLQYFRWKNDGTIRKGAIQPPRF